MKTGSRNSRRNGGRNRKSSSTFSRVLQQNAQLSQFVGNELSKTALLTLIGKVGFAFSLVVNNVQNARAALAVMFTGILNAIAQRNGLAPVSILQISEILGNLQINPDSRGFTTTDSKDGVMTTAYSRPTFLMKTVLADMTRALINSKQLQGLGWQNVTVNDSTLYRIITNEWTTCAAFLNRPEIGLQKVVSWKKQVGTTREQRNATYVQALGISTQTTTTETTTATTGHFMDHGTGGNGHSKGLPELATVGTGNGTPRG